MVLFYLGILPVNMANWDSIDPWIIRENIPVDARSNITTLNYQGVDRRGEKLPAAAQHLLESNPTEFCNVIMKRARLLHPAISQFVGLILSPSSSKPEWFVFENLEFSLKDKITSTSAPLKIDEIIEISYKICQVLVYLHSKQLNVAHGNLTLSAIFINRGNSVKIGKILEQQFKNQSKDIEELKKQDIRSLGYIVLQLANRSLKAPTLETYKNTISNYPVLTSLLNSCIGANQNVEALAILKILKKLDEHHKISYNIDTNKRYGEWAENNPKKQKIHLT